MFSRFGQWIFLILWAVIAQGYDTSTDLDIEQLYSRFSDQIKKASEDLQHAKVKNAGVYWLTFGTEAVETAPDRVGKILRAVPMQADRIATTIQDANFSDKERKDATNHIGFKIGFRVLEKRIADSCRSCRTEEDRKVFRKAARDFMNIFDFQDQDLSPSALIFYSSVKEKFQNPLFIQRTILLRDELNTIIHNFAHDDTHIEKKALYDVALRVCDGNRKDAVELVALLLTRDVGSILYFEYIRAASPEFVKAVGEVAIKVRLISELDQVSRGIEGDRFSYDGKFSSRNIKNYYFWSGAFVGQRLRELGYSSAIVRDLVASMPHQYKMFAGFQMKLRSMGIIKYPFIDENRFHADVYEVIRNSARGNRFSESEGGDTMCRRFYKGK